jgi:hypothetical protein
MSLVHDVKHEAALIDKSPNALRKFGLVIGGTFLALTLLAVRQEWDDTLLIGFLAAGSALALLATTLPTLLKQVFLTSLAASLAIGWCLSRVTLITLFVLGVLPVAVVGRLLDYSISRALNTPAHSSYWLNQKSRNVGSVGPIA